MSQRKPYAFLLLVGLLLAFGGIFYFAIESVNREIAPAAKGGRGSSKGGRGVSVAVLRAGIEKGDIAAITAELSRGGGTINGQFYLLDAGRRQVSLLTYAAMHGNAEVIRSLIAAGAKPEEASDDWGTPLMMAAAKGDLESMSELIKSGAKVNEQNKSGETALIMAVRTGTPEKVRVLLAAGASAKIADHDGTTPLAVAAGSDAPAAVVKVLIEAGAEVDAANREGVTPLMMAAGLGDADKCMLLLSAGANTKLKDGNEWTALDWAGQRSDSAGKRCQELLSQAGK